MKKTPGRYRALLALSSGYALPDGRIVTGSGQSPARLNASMEELFRRAGLISEHRRHKGKTPLYEWRLTAAGRAQIEEWQRDKS